MSIGKTSNYMCHLKRLGCTPCHIHFARLTFDLKFFNVVIKAGADLTIVNK